MSSIIGKGIILFLGIILGVGVTTSVALLGMNQQNAELQSQLKAQQVLISDLQRNLSYEMELDTNFRNNLQNDISQLKSSITQVGGSSSGLKDSIERLGVTLKDTVDVTKASISSTSTNYNVLKDSVDQTKGSIEKLSTRHDKLEALLQNISRVTRAPDSGVSSLQPDIVIIKNAIAELKADLVRVNGKLDSLALSPSPKSFDVSITSEGKYRPGDKVTISVLFTNNGALVDPTTITIAHVHRPDNVIDQLLGTQARVHAGWYYFNYAIPPNAPSGTFAIHIGTTYNGQASNAQASFQVSVSG
ncbi:MAG: hypothetical protein HYY67_01125 [Thaumarchaeota archaeon]|nr:hypothetical protein [Nitrososphaerota archaeon]